MKWHCKYGLAKDIVRQYEEEPSRKNMWGVICGQKSLCSASPDGLVSDRGLPCGLRAQCSKETRRVGLRCVKSVEELKRSPVGVVWVRRVPAQVSSTSLDHVKIVVRRQKPSM
ncbi:hypothetical protein TNCV_4455031 [Trichonephila clavipes]|nr:hypothetical protein TNCV_4455031 [Trichonephila clavipes]